MTFPSSASSSQLEAKPPPSPARTPPKLSRHQVRDLIALGQRWRSADGTCWTVRNPLYRDSGWAWLHDSGGRVEQVSFTELGARYRLQEQEESG